MERQPPSELRGDLDDLYHDSRILADSTYDIGQYPELTPSDTFLMAKAETLLRTANALIDHVRAKYC